MIAKLTKRAVDAAHAGPNDVFIWDQELGGFGLKVTPKNRRVFIYQYWSPAAMRVRRRVTLGSYGALTVEQARSLARQMAGRVAAGEDPVDSRARRETQRAATVEQLATEYLEEIRPKKQIRTIESYSAHLRLYVLPRLGKKPVSDISHKEVVHLHSDLSDKPVTANRVIAFLGAFMRWCERRGYRPRGSNPCADVEWFPEHSRERFLTVAEIARLSEALRIAESSGLPTPLNLRRKPGRTEKRKHVPRSLAPMPANPFAVAAIRFLLLSGWREREALTLEWSHVDVARGHATLPRTKTGKSHRPLGAAALTLLSELPRLEGNPYVFPGTKKGEHLKEIRRTWYAARHAAGLDDVRLHDLRHTVASFAVGAGHSLVLTGSLLGHVNPSTTKKYAHLQDDARRATADAVSGAIAAAMSAQVAPSRIIPVRKEG